MLTFIPVHLKFFNLNGKFTIWYSYHMVYFSEKLQTVRVDHVYKSLLLPKGDLIRSDNNIVSWSIFLKIYLFEGLFHNKQKILIDYLFKRQDHKRKGEDDAGRGHHFVWPIRGEKESASISQFAREGFRESQSFQQIYYEKI